MRETMCKEELKEFNKIKKERERLKEEFDSGKISGDNFTYSMTELLTRLNNLEKKYDEIYLKEENDNI